MGYARRNSLVPVPEVDSVQELNDLLRQRCLAEAGRRLRGETQPVGELWERERQHLLSLPAHPFPCCRTVPVRPNRLSMVTFQTNRYSVPVAHAGEVLFLRALANRVEITDGTWVIAAHERCYGRERDILDVFHYLPLLKQRPGAFDHAKPLKAWKHPAARLRAAGLPVGEKHTMLFLVNLQQLVQFTYSHQWADPPASILLAPNLAFRYGLSPQEEYPPYFIRVWPGGQGTMFCRRVDSYKLPKVRTAFPAHLMSSPPKPVF